MKHKMLYYHLLQDGSIAVSQHLPLREEFVHSLCIADQLGVLRSIEHIVRTLHARTGTQTDARASTETDCESSDHEDQRGEGNDLMTRMDELDLGEHDTKHRDVSEKRDEETVKHKAPLDQDGSSINRTGATSTATSAINSSSSAGKKLRFYGVGTGTFFNS